ncbi:hypothetical protein HPB47_018449 [Ixodes persulcatus]|uniref:Uncharacterized protein n=1 Tax=Ixodes persulcatus TaxID=34615 RepID=A0AC60QP67_IXOPE|nr:hypothetical protein HPB47_018449 [Ixodes persulcatus]
MTGRRYTKRTKQFAATLHYCSSQAYTYVSTLFPLPSVSSLKCWLKVVGGWPGFTKEALGDLQRRHENSSEREKLCVVMLDLISIKQEISLDVPKGRLIGYVDFCQALGPGETDEVPMATEALVFMVVGPDSPWKMPFGYFLTNGVSGLFLKSLLEESIVTLEESIVALEDCGLHIKALVCDGLGANVAMAKLLGCHVHEISYENKNTTFEHPTQPTEKVHFIFDACHALKLPRNLLGDNKVLKCMTPRIANRDANMPRSCFTYNFLGMLPRFPRSQSSVGCLFHR